MTINDVWRKLPIKAQNKIATTAANLLVRAAVVKYYYDRLKEYLHGTSK